MRLHELKPAAGSNRDRKRLGRGNASGQGTTAGKGTKGQKARSGGAKAGFRGMSSRNQRTAKRRGFNNIFKKQFEIVNLDKLGGFEAGTVITPEALVAAKLIRGEAPNVKVLGNGDLGIALRFENVHVSSSARTKIEAAGGSVSRPIEANVTQAPTEDDNVVVAVPQETSDDSGSA